MKLHLGSKTTICVKPPELPIIHYKNHLYHYSTPYIYVSRVEDGLVIQKLKYEDVGAMQIYADKLFVFTNEVYVLDLINYDILEIVKLSKGIVGRAVFASYDSTGRTYLLSKISGEIVLVRDGKAEIVAKSESCCDWLFILPDMFGYVNKESLVIYNNKRVALREEIEDVVSLFTAHSGVYTVDKSGVLREWMRGTEINIGPVDSAMFKDGTLYVSTGVNVRKYNLEGVMLGIVGLSDKLEDYCGKAIRKGVDNDDGVKRKKLSSFESNSAEGECDLVSESVTESDSNSTEDKRSLTSENTSAQTSTNLGQQSVIFIQESPDLIVLEDSQVIIHQDFEIMKIFVFNFGSADSLLMNDILMVATASGDIAYTEASKYVGEEHLFDGRMIRCHNDSITAMTRYGRFVFTGSRDATAVLWELTVSCGKLQFREIRQFSQSSEPVVALDYNHGILAIATYDHILQIYKEDKRWAGCEQECESGNAEEHSDEMLIADGVENGVDISQGSIPYFTNISVQRIHSRQINNVHITSKYVITASSDKSAKILNHSGECVKTFSSDKYLCTAHTDKYIALCGHKTIKVLDNGLNQMASFQVKRPVLSCCFYGEVLLGCSDIVRVYDISKGKCIKTYDFDVQNCWSFSFPFLCGESKILMLSDISKETNEKLAESLRLEKEENQLLGVYHRDKNYKLALEIAIKRNDYKKMFRIVCDEYYSERSLASLDAFNGCKSKLIEMLLKNPGLKYIEIFNVILQKEKEFIRTNKLYEICKKHSKAVDDIYTLLLGLDLYN